MDPSTSRPTFTAALAQLAAATTHAELLEARRVLQRALRRKRKADGQALGSLAQTYAAAIDAWDQQKAAGASFDERTANLERTLRAAWPQERAWHYICQRCDDTGWIYGECSTLTPCGRPFALPKQRMDDFTGRGKCLAGHAFIRPCLCAKGDRHRAAQEGRAPAGDFRDTGKSDFSKPGRRSR